MLRRLWWRGDASTVPARRSPDRVRFRWTRSRPGRRVACGRATDTSQKCNRRDSAVFANVQPEPVWPTIARVVLMVPTCVSPSPLALKASGGSLSEEHTPIDAVMVGLHASRALQELESWLNAIEGDVTPVETRPLKTQLADAFQEADDVEPGPAAPVPYAGWKGWLDQMDESLPDVESPADRAPRRREWLNRMDETRAGVESPADRARRGRGSKATGHDADSSASSPHSGGDNRDRSGPIVGELHVLLPAVAMQPVPQTAAADSTPVFAMLSTEPPPASTTSVLEGCPSLPAPASVAVLPNGLAQLDEHLKELKCVLTDLEQRLDRRTITSSFGVEYLSQRGS